MMLPGNWAVGIMFGMAVMSNRDRILQLRRYTATPPMMPDRPDVLCYPSQTVNSERARQMAQPDRDQCREENARSTAHAPPDSPGPSAARAYMEKNERLQRPRTMASSPGAHVALCRSPKATNACGVGADVRAGSLPK
jgi:hypothetical protein